MYQLQHVTFSKFVEYKVDHVYCDKEFMFVKHEIY